MSLEILEIKAVPTSLVVQWYPVFSLGLLDRTASFKPRGYAVVGA